MIIAFPRPPAPAPAAAPVQPAPDTQLSLADARRIAATPDLMWPAFLVSEAQDVLQAARLQAIAPEPASALRTIAIDSPQGLADQREAARRYHSARARILRHAAVGVAACLAALFAATLTLQAARSAAADAATARDISALTLSGW